MERELGVTKAREKLRELVDKVQYQGDTYILRRHGKPAAAVVPIQVYESWRKQRKELFDLIRQMQKEANLDIEQAERLAAEAIAVVRAEARQGR